MTLIDYPSSQDINFLYNELDQRISMSDQLGNTVWTYDNSTGLLISENGPWSDDTISYQYSQAKRQELSFLPAGIPWSQSYTYDSLGRLSTISSPAGNFSYEYNVQNGSGTTPVYSPKRSYLPNGAYIESAYDNLGRVASREMANVYDGSLNPKVTYSYTGARLTQTTHRLDNEGYRYYEYDALHRLTRFNPQADSSWNRICYEGQRTYHYDAAGNLDQRTINNFTQNFQFRTNDKNQLLTATRSGAYTVSGYSPYPVNSATINGVAALRTDSTRTFSRTDVSLSNGTNFFTIAVTDTLGRSNVSAISVNLPATVSFSYDANGNLISDGLRSLVYDEENRLKSVTLTNQCRTEFVYDGLGRLRQRSEFYAGNGQWVQSGWVRYVYDGWLVVLETWLDRPYVAYTRGLDLSNSREGAGGIGGLLARSQMQGPTLRHHYYFSDAQGNVLNLADESRNLTAYYRYDPYGQLLSMRGYMAETNLYRFSSKPWHETSGTYYYGFRFYDPNLQRWLSRDPFRESGGYNLYAFNNNSPVSWIDPNGLAPQLTSVTYDPNTGSIAYDYSPDYPSARPSGQIPAVDWSGTWDFFFGNPPGAKIGTMWGPPGSGCFGSAIKRGPKTKPFGPHNEKIQERIRELKDQGHTHTHGGSLTEEVIRTPGGKKSTRRPDITTKDPNGEVYRENVGKTKADGTLPKRETDALDDIQGATGKRVGYTPYD